ncbi:hypothetical protein [Streptomyces sp. NPDC054975]
MVRRRVALVTPVWVAGGLAAGGLWWWAVLRLVLVPEQSGLVEGAVAAGGWGLSLLPVHVTASAAVGGRTRGRPARSGPGRSVRSGPGHVGRAVRDAGGAAQVTTASRRRRWGGGSDPS